jgi:membrane protein
VIIIVAVMLVMVAFSAQVALTAAEQVVYRLLPFAREIAGWIGLSRLVPGVVMFGALYILFYTLTPSRYRFSNSPKWPGALFTSVWWLTTTALLPVVLSLLGGYNRTYGSLAGVIIMLFFFWLVGLGMVIGAHVNAALAESPSPSLKEAPKETEEASWPV